MQVQVLFVILYAIFGGQARVIAESNLPLSCPPNRATEYCLQVSPTKVSWWVDLDNTQAVEPEQKGNVIAISGATITVTQTFKDGGYSEEVIQVPYKVHLPLVVGPSAPKQDVGSPPGE